DYQSHPLDPIDQSLSEGMVLHLPGYGAIACIHLSTGDTELDIPVCLQDNPIAYIAVELDADLSNGSILGFLPQTDQAIVRVEALQPMTELPQHLAQFNPVGATLTQLNRWWQRSFSQGWELISELTDPLDENLTPALRGGSTVDSQPSETLSQNQNNPDDGLMCQKTIQLGTDTFALALTMARFATNADPSIGLNVRLSPSIGDAHLPENIQLIASDEADNVFSAMRSRESSASLELRFRADPGDRFKLKIVLNEVTLTELFEV
ncbi:MAG: DUF1822 family protein, partial [Cyanobacteria bacterium J06642_11]